MNPLFSFTKANSFFKAVEESAAGKLTEEDKKFIQDKCSSVLSWLDANSLAEKEEFEDKLKEIQKECSPIMLKLHQGGGGGGSTGGAAPQGGKGPTVEEVD